jgi:aquaglyceroporin related protein
VADWLCEFCCSFLLSSLPSPSGEAITLLTLSQAINPARDFGPRVFSAFIYGREVFTAAGFYFVVPLFVPIFGCIAGAAVYDACLFEGEGSAVTDALDAAEGHDGRIALE